MNPLPVPFIPLAEYDQWITWRLEPDEDRPGKWAKRPCLWSTGNVADPHLPQHQTSYANALTGLPLVTNGHGGGIGFVLTDNDPFWFLDADNHLQSDNQWTPMVYDLMRRLPGVAVEISQSGHGLHWIGSGAVPPHGCRNAAQRLEFYHRRRFIAMTGIDAIGDVRAAPDVSDIIAEFFPKGVLGSGAPLDDWTDIPCPEWRGPESDDELIVRMLKSRDSAAVNFGTRASFKSVWSADDAELAKHFPPDGAGIYNASSADQALFTRIAWWTGQNCERVRRVAFRSGLRREKWDNRPDYIETSILRACGAITGCLQDKPPVPLPPAETSPRPSAIVPRADRPIGAIPNDKNDHTLITEWLWAQGWDVRYDMFSDRIVLDDGMVLDDNLEREAWLGIRLIGQLKFPKDLFGEALRARAWERRFHPVRDYLDMVQPVWDGVPRIDRWLIDHAGAADTPFVRAAGRLFLIAAARRARVPGCKFDELLVLESPQGRGKSTLFEMLCPDPAWFTDNISLSMSTKEIMETMQGKWIVEAPELSKLSDAAVEHVKAMLSRRFDKARLAYARNAIETGRGCVWGGTTNSSHYLRDRTGNRRFWPVVCGVINLASLPHVRDQLWAEAAQREAAGESIRLDESLWEAAAIEQEERMVDDPIEATLSALLGDRTGRIKPKVLWDALNVPVDRQSRLNRQFGEAMKSLGWQKKRISVMNEKIYFYIKGGEAREIIIGMSGICYAEPMIAIISPT